MKKKAKKSYIEILRTHPLPGVRLERAPDGQRTVHLGRPGLFSRAVPLHEEIPEQPTRQTEEAPQTPAETGQSTVSPAEELWLQGADLCQQALGVPPGAREEIEERAAGLFAAALEADPGMTDAMLGLHLTSVESRTEMTAMMISAIDRFGETRNRFGRRFSSVYFPLVFSGERLETRDDLLRAWAKDLALEGSAEEARNALATTDDCLMNDLVALDILFHEGRYSEAIVSAQATTGGPGLSVYLENDLALVQAISFLRDGHATVAIRMLEELASSARLTAVQHFARYEMARAALGEGAYPLARHSLEALLDEDPDYRDAREMLRFIESEETTVPGEVTSTTDDFSELARSFYSEQVADDPALPDNQ